MGANILPSAYVSLRVSLSGRPLTLINRLLYEVRDLIEPIASRAESEEQHHQDEEREPRSTISDYHPLYFLLRRQGFLAY